MSKDNAPTLSDTEAVDQIAELLGGTRWDSPADFLEAIANVIGETGRTHPGSTPMRYYGVNHDPLDVDEPDYGEA